MYTGYLLFPRFTYTTDYGVSRALDETIFLADCRNFIISNLLKKSMFLPINPVYILYK